MPAIFWVRLGFTLLCLISLLLVVKNQQAVARGLQRFFFEPSSALNLGLLRVAIFYLMFEAALTNPASWFASLDPDFVDFPRGWVWLADLYPIAIRWVRPAELLFIGSSALALVGLFTRLSSIVSSLLAVWLMGVTNFYFKIGHSSHVPTLCAVLLSCSPCGDALSVDALIARLTGKGPLERSAAYTVPVRFAWLLLGTGYLFPGLWKLWESGDLWLNGTKLRVELLSKWAQLPDFVPTFRADHSLPLLIFFGTMTLVFEVGFFFALFNRVSRVIAGFTATGFHLGVGLSMNIWFSLGLPMIVLIDFPEILAMRPFAWIAPPLQRAWAWLAERLQGRIPRLRNDDRAPRPLPPPPGASFAVGSIFLLGMFVAGLGPVDSWPLSIYPRFSERSYNGPRTSFGLAFTAQPPGGAEQDLKIQFRPFEDTAGVYRLVRSAIQAKSRHHDQALGKYVSVIARVVRENSPKMPKGTKLFIYRFDFHVDPEDRVHDKRQRSLIAEAEF
jgi:hypothetical protein